MTTEVERAWAAGFVDGEGYVGIKRCVDTRGNKPQTFSLQFQVSQRNRVPLDLLVKFFGGSVGKHSIAKHADTTYWEWRICGAAGLAALEAIYPYLVNKKHVAGIVIEFARWYQSTRVKADYGRTGQFMPTGRRERAEGYWEEVRRVNRLYRTVPTAVPQPLLATGTDN